jgi:hypothetical protein
MNPFGSEFASIGVHSRLKTESKYALEKMRQPRSDGIPAVVTPLSPNPPASESFNLNLQLKLLTSTGGAAKYPR